MEYEAYYHSVCLCVPPQLLLNQMADFYEIQREDHGIEDDLDVILLIPYFQFQNGGL
jgi:hypothetical protein